MFLFIGDTSYCKEIDGIKIKERYSWTSFIIRNCGMKASIGQPPVTSNVEMHRPVGGFVC